MEFIKYFIRTWIQIALFREAKHSKHTKNECGRNSISSVLPFFSAQSISTEQTKRVTFILEFGTSLMLSFFSSMGWQHPQGFKSHKPLQFPQFPFQVLPKLRLDVDPQILPIRQWHQQQREGPEDCGHCSSSCLSQWLCSSCWKNLCSLQMD